MMQMITGEITFTITVSPRREGRASLVSLAARIKYGCQMIDLAVACDDEQR
jgi:hypothetical protein